MDINDLRIAVTLLSLVLFVLLVRHAWSRRRRAEYDLAAMLPFCGDTLEQTLAAQPEQAGGQRP